MNNDLMRRLEAQAESTADDLAQARKRLDNLLDIAANVGSPTLKGKAEALLAEILEQCADAVALNEELDAAQDAE